LPSTRLSPRLLQQVVLVLIVLGLLLATTVPARSDELTDSWSLRDVVRQLEPGVVWILADMGDDLWSQGSGFIVHEDGYILTNAHVVVGARNIIIGWPDRFDRSEKEAEIVASDIDLDLALLHVDAVHLPTVPLDLSRPMGIGDAVITLGYPAGEELGLGGLTVTRGVLSCIRCSEDGDVALLQTDAAVTLGCSGGPLYDLDTGSVVGIIQGKGMLLLEGFNFAIPVQDFFDFSGTSPGDGVPTAISGLGGLDEGGFSSPCARSLELFSTGLLAREDSRWGEALSNFMAASRLYREDPQAAYGIAESYAALDQAGQSLRWLERAFELGYSDFENALNGDGFDSFRDDARFVELVQSFRGDG
jgi:hypothetical protein